MASREPIKLGAVETVDAQTGQVVERRECAMTLLPPPPGTCPECAVEHDEEQPHNQQSFYYQTAFRARHGRWPTWTDAMAHCDDDVRAFWRRHLVELMRTQGLEIPSDLLAPPEGKP